MQTGLPAMYRQLAVTGMLHILRPADLPILHTCTGQLPIRGWQANFVRRTDAQLTLMQKPTNWYQAIFPGQESLTIFSYLLHIILSGSRLYRSLRLGPRGCVQPIVAAC